MYYYYINKFQTSTIAGQLNWNVKHGEKNSLCFTWGFEHSMGRQSTYNDIYIYICLYIIIIYGLLSIDCEIQKIDLCYSEADGAYTVYFL